MSASRPTEKSDGGKSDRQKAVNEGLYAIVPAAGFGSRMNSDTPKQYIEIDGLSVLSHTIDRLLQVKDLIKIVVVLDEAGYHSDCLARFHSPQIGSPSVESCIGGASRAESVLNGLLHLQSVCASTGQVLVHDAARPCVRVDEINRLVAETAGDSNGGLLAMPVVDTIKRADNNQCVAETVDRRQLWRAATPQVFPYKLLLDNLSKAIDAGVEITDEASAMQHAGYAPKLVECSADNIKVTTSTDLALAAHYLAAQND